MTVSLLKRSALNNAGTFTAPLIAKFDSNNATVAPTCRAYTGNSTAEGAFVALLQYHKFHIDSSGGMAVVADEHFGMDGKQRITLRGKSDILGINLNNAVLTDRFNVYLEFTVENL